MNLKPILSLAALCALSLAPAQDRAKYGNYEAITADRLKAHLEFVAHDLLEGRDTPSRGLDIASWYVATQLSLWGVKPGGDDGTYFQRIAIVRPAVDPEKTTLSFGGKTRKFGDGFYSQPTAGKQTGTMVFVGNGYEVPELGADPYKGIDVKGKIVVRTWNTPKGFSMRDAMSGKYKLYRDPMQAAMAHGAIGVIQIINPDSVDRWTEMVERASRPSFPQIVGGRRGGPQLPSISVTPALAKDFFEGEDVTAEDVIKRAQAGDTNSTLAMKGFKIISFDIAGSENAVYTQNVVGIIPGADPKLKNEYVALGAHIDHVGKREGTGDTIFNGADDDGSGTVAILEIAHAMAMGQKPKRSILFVWHTGEEKGLWGSSHFTANPPMPINSIIAQLNIDMIGRSKNPGDTNARNKMLTESDAIYVVGSRRLSNDLGNTVATVNGSLYKLKYDYHYDAPNDPENIYQRSDHYNYAAKGIPIAFWFDGVHEDYHRPGDEVAKIDFKKVQAITRTICATAFAIAQNPARPKVDEPVK